VRSDSADFSTRDGATDEQRCGFGSVALPFEGLVHTVGDLDDAVGIGWRFEAA
jgi:hypothetical protein